MLMVACVFSVCACCSVAVLFALRPLVPLSCAAGTGLGGTLNVVDLYNSATGAWSTAQLSEARFFLAAASVGNVAFFAGGVTVGALLCRDREGGGVDGCVCVECLRVLQCCGSVCLATSDSLMHGTAGGSSNAVDVYNSATGAWSTAQLSVARGGLAAASVGNVALFAGGSITSVLLCRDGGGAMLMVPGVFALAAVLRL